MFFWAVEFERILKVTSKGGCELDLAIRMEPGSPPSTVGVTLSIQTFSRGPNKFPPVPIQGNLTGALAPASGSSGIGSSQAEAVISCLFSKLSNRTLRSQLRLRFELRFKNLLWSE